MNLRPERREGAGVSVGEAEGAQDYGVAMKPERWARQAMVVRNSGPIPTGMRRC